MAASRTLYITTTPARVEPGSFVQITIGGLLPSDVGSGSIASAVIDGGEVEIYAYIGQDGAGVASGDARIRADVSPGEHGIEVRRGGPDGDVLGNVALTVSVSTSSGVDSVAQCPCRR
jgi:hypothetical protein